MTNGISNVPTDISGKVNQSDFDNPNNIKAWISTQTYNEGNMCVWAGKTYISRRNSNVNHTPTEYLSTWWFQEGHFILYDRGAQGNSTLRPYHFGFQNGIQHLLGVDIPELNWNAKSNWTGIRINCTVWTMNMSIELPFNPWTNQNDMSVSIPCTQHDAQNWSYTMGCVIQNVTATKGYIGGRFFRYDQTNTNGTASFADSGATINRVELY